MTFSNVTFTCVYGLTVPFVLMLIANDMSIADLRSAVETFTSFRMYPKSYNTVEADVKAGNTVEARFALPCTENRSWPSPMSFGKPIFHATISLNMELPFCHRALVLSSR